MHNFDGITPNNFPFSHSPIPSPDDEATDSSLTVSDELLFDPDEDFHKNWMSVVHGSVPCTLDDAVKLAALQYQSYFLDRTAVHSVVGFCR